LTLIAEELCDEQYRFHVHVCSMSNGRNFWWVGLLSSLLKPPVRVVHV